jgi:glutamyl-tRNA reductase
MFQGALEVGKRVRNETEIGTRPVSVAFAGVKLAERIFGKLNNHRALIIGAGATSEQVVRHLCDRGVKQLRVLNRTAEHALDLAARFGGEVIPWENLAGALEWPDLLVTSVSGAEPILTRAAIERAMGRRGNRALLMIDLGVPRNVAAGVGDLYNTYLYNIDDLTEIVEQNKKARQAEIPRVEAIIEEQIEKFMHWQAGVAASAVAPRWLPYSKSLRIAWCSNPPSGSAVSRNYAASSRTSNRCGIFFISTGRSLEGAANRDQRQRVGSLAGPEHQRSPPRHCRRPIRTCDREDFR